MRSYAIMADMYGIANVLSEKERIEHMNTQRAASILLSGMSRISHISQGPIIMEIMSNIKQNNMKMLKREQKVRLNALKSFFPSSYDRNRCVADVIVPVKIVANSTIPAITLNIPKSSSPSSLSTIREV